MSETYRHYLQPQVVSRLANMELRARLVVEGFITGLHRSPYHGFSVEFAEHRPYMPGDEIKHIDWKLYGKTDRHYVKRYEEETNLKAYLILDTSRSMAYASEGRVSKLEYASSLAAALAYMMVKQQDAVGLAMFDEALTSYLPPRATHGYLRQILIALQNASASGRTGAGKALHQVADRVKRRGLVIVLSDLLDTTETVMAALKHFRYKKNEVIVMQVLDPLERSFALGVDRVEGEAGFPRPGEARDHDELSSRDLEVDVLQVVLTRPADDNRVAGGLLPKRVGRAGGSGRGYGRRACHGLRVRRFSVPLHQLLALVQVRDQRGVERR